MAAYTSRKHQRRINKEKIPFEEKYLALLQALRHANKEQRLSLLRSADQKLVKYICECALNVLSGVVALKISEKNKLKKYKKLLRDLTRVSKRKGGWKSKKNIIIQRGGNFLAFLLPPVLDLFLRAVTGK